MFIMMVFMMYINAKGMPTKDTENSSCIKAINLFNQLYSVHIMPLVINSLGVDIHTNTHTYRRPHRINFKKPNLPVGAWFKRVNPCRSM